MPRSNIARLLSPFAVCLLLGLLLLIVSPPISSAGPPSAERFEVSLLKDLNTATVNADIISIANVGGTLYFSANDGVHGLELWKSDGTLEGTGLVKDINPHFPYG